MNTIDKKEFTKHLLNNTNIDTQSVFEWAIWNKICEVSDITINILERYELVYEAVETEMQKWLKPIKEEE